MILLLNLLYIIKHFNVLTIILFAWFWRGIWDFRYTFDNMQFIFIIKTNDTYILLLLKDKQNTHGTIYIRAA